MGPKVSPFAFVCAGALPSSFPRLGGRRRAVSTSNLGRGQVRVPRHSEGRGQAAASGVLLGLGAEENLSIWAASVSATKKGSARPAAFISRKEGLSGSREVRRRPSKGVGTPPAVSRRLGQANLSALRRRIRVSRRRKGTRRPYLASQGTSRAVCRTNSTTGGRNAGIVGKGLICATALRILGVSNILCSCGRPRRRRSDARPASRAVA